MTAKEKNDNNNKSYRPNLFTKGKFESNDQGFSMKKIKIQKYSFKERKMAGEEEEVSLGSFGIRLWFHRWSRSERIRVCAKKLLILESHFQ